MLATRWSVEERELTAQLIRASMIYHAVMTTGFLPYTQSYQTPYNPTSGRANRNRTERVIVNNLNLIRIYLVYALATVNNVR